MLLVFRTAFAGRGLYRLQKWERCRARLIGWYDLRAAVNALIVCHLPNQLMEMIPTTIYKVFNVFHHFVESRVVAAFWAPQVGGFVNCIRRVHH